MGALLLVRHGQADAHGDDYDRLVDQGRQQCRILGESLRARGLVPDRVVRGDMRRHAETAEEAFPGHACEVDAGWNEFDHVGILARVGADGQDFRAWLETASARWTAGAHDDEYAESWPAFTTRVGEALRSAAARPGLTAVVTSGGAIAWTAASLLHPDASPAELARLWRRLNDVCVNAGLTRVVSGRSGITLVGFNEQAHLDGTGLLTYR